MLTLSFVVQQPRIAIGRTAKRQKRQTTGALTAEQVVETALEILLDKVTD